MRRPEDRFVTRLTRYAMAAIGPIGSAGAQFALSLALLRTLPPDQFGVFSFLLVTSQFSAGLLGALFCAPLPVLVARRQPDRQPRMLSALFGANLVGAAFAFLVFGVLAARLGTSAVAVVLFAAYAAVSLLRWFARTYAYATGRPLRTMWSDLVYSGALLAGTAIAFLKGSGTLDAAFGALLVGAAAGMLPFGAAHLRRQCAWTSFDVLRDYGVVWREHSSWSLLGVVTTEATANAHVYLVTALSGPSVFAPVAASALLIRPIQVAMNALMEFERAQMAAQIGDRRIAAAGASVRFFRLMLTAAWTVTAAAALLILAARPGLLFPSHYDLAALRLGAALWLGVAGIRLWRTPESALLQAAGAFKPLALASVASAGVSVAAVWALLSAFGVIWSIAGIGFGEAVFAWCTWRQARRWRIQAMAAQPPVSGLAAATGTALDFPLAEEGARP